MNTKSHPGRWLKLGVRTRVHTTLFITGHSYGAANASLVGILSRDLAEPDSIFCYPFATPNYNRHGLTGDDMKMI
jgi:hypothetical protein